MLRHTLKSGHSSVLLNGFKIFRKGFNNNRVKRKISDALLIKQYRPTLNTQENSISLELYNQGLLRDTFCGSSCHIETSLQICTGSYLVGFCMMRVLTEGVSEKLLAIKDTYMINTVVIVMKRFGTSSKTLLLKFYCFFKTCRFHPL